MSGTCSGCDSVQCLCAEIAADKARRRRRVSLLKRVLRLLTRDHRRGGLCEPCGRCPACKGVDAAVELVSSALEPEHRVIARKGSACRHCNRIGMKCGVPDDVCAHCGKKSTDEATP